MEPRIPDGALCVFRANPAGSRQGKIVLAQHRDIFDPDTGGAFSIKRYESRKSSEADGTWTHEAVTLCPLNSTYNPIHVNPDDADSFRIVAEFLGVIS
jgi:SOS-response transcriptional repressor LexA